MKRLYKSSFEVPELNQIVSDLTEEQRASFYHGHQKARCAKPVGFAAFHLTGPHPWVSSSSAPGARSRVHNLNTSPSGTEARAHTPHAQKKMTPVVNTQSRVSQVWEGRMSLTPGKLGKHQEGHD